MALTWRSLIPSGWRSSPPRGSCTRWRTSTPAGWRTSTSGTSCRRSPVPTASAGPRSPSRRRWTSAACGTTARISRPSAWRRRAPGHSSGKPDGDEFATYCLVTLLASNGVEVLGPASVTLATPASVEAMELLRSLADDGILPEAAVSYQRDRPIQMLAEGEAVLSFGGSYEAPLLARRAGIPVDQVTRRFGFAPMPAGPHGRQSVLVGGMVYCVPRQARQPKLAASLLQDAVATQALARMCARTGHIPPRRSAVAVLASRSAFHAHTAGLLDGAVHRPVTPTYALVSAQLRAMVEAVLTRRLPPRAAVWRTAEMISAITGLPVRQY